MKFILEFEKQNGDTKAVECEDFNFLPVDAHSGLVHNPECCAVALLGEEIEVSMMNEKGEPVTQKRRRIIAYEFGITSIQIKENSEKDGKRN